MVNDACVVWQVMRMLGTATKFVDTLAAQMQKAREDAAAAAVSVRADCMRE
jgi:hypothetical protein